MRLHHQPRSRSTRVLWILEELGIPFDLTIMSRDTKQTPEYRALHPLGRAPALEEEGGPVFESGALILHIADQNLDAGLIAPLGSHERALQY
ncbi:glutathione S-transferase N-terminal domain-containing protein, partial [Gaiella sp.]